MSIDIVIALVGFAFVTSVTPGPNNLMLLSSGVNFGLRASLPHMLGVGLGFGAMIAILGLGLAQVFSATPELQTGLKIAGGLYMLWLAWKIANAGQVGEGRASGSPITFLQAALFQWVNPKAWFMAITAIAAYAVPPDYYWSLLMVIGVFVAINIPSIGMWTLFGVGLRRVLSNPRHLRVFNVIMAVLLVLSLWPLFR
jgi:threonine/homoserine/homoserine lactone efflux protein